MYLVSRKFLVVRLKIFSKSWSNIINFGKKLTSQKEAVDTSVINTEKTNSCFMCTLDVKTNVLFYKVKKTY